MRAFHQLLQGSFLFKKKQENGRFFTHISLKNIDMGKKSPIFTTFHKNRSSATTSPRPGSNKHYALLHT